MLRHLMAYATKIEFRDRDGLLYGIIFPLAFALIYLSVFSGLLKANTFEPIPVALYIEGTADEVVLAEKALANIAAMGEINDQGQLVQKNKTETSPLIIYLPVNSHDAGQKATEDYHLTGTVIVDSQEHRFAFALDIAPNQINQLNTTILHTILKTFTMINKGVTTAMAQATQGRPNPQMIHDITQQLENIQDISLIEADDTFKNTTGYSIFIYASLAYICIFFMSTSSFFVLINEANSSPQALRKIIAPVSKTKHFLATFITGTIPSLLIVYTILGLYIVTDLPIGQEYGRLFLLLTLGTLVGISLGTVTASLLRSSPNVLQAITIGLPLLFAAGSGMMSQDLKVMINEGMPWFNKINPVALINDGIYYLNNYPTYEQYNLNVMILLVMFILFMTLTIVGLRRDTYASL